MFSIEASAKVNLCLAVKFPPENGYHLLDSVFQELPLKDVLHFDVRGIDDCIDSPKCACTELGTTVELDCGPIDIPVESNLIFRAVQSMELAVGAPVVLPDQALAIRVEKHIPAGGGLGGGSSDAAATIKACCKLLDIALDDPRCVSVARSLGADVAFFLVGGAALMDERGDRFVRELPGFPLPLVLMGEHEGISTSRIYGDFDANPPQAPDAQALVHALDAFPTWGASRKRKLELAKLCANNLEPAAFAALPRLEERVRRAQEDPDVLHALVTGSGATSYAICSDEGAAMRFEKRAAAYCDWTCIC